MNIKFTKSNAFMRLGAVIENLDAEKEYTAEIKEVKPHRSKDANAYFWTLTDQLAEKTKIAKTDIYKNYVKEIGGNSTTVCVPNKAVEDLINGWKHNGIGWVADTFESKIDGCTNVILYYGSSTYDSSQMHRLIELVVADCKEQDIETLTPEELARLNYG